MSFSKDKRAETIIYLVLWAILFMAPVLSLSIRVNSNSNLTFDWSEIFMVWRQYGIFFLVFLIHNHLMAPMLVYRQKKALYIIMTLVIVVIFQVYQCNHRPNFGEPRPLHEMQQGGPGDDGGPGDMREGGPASAEFDGERPPIPPELEGEEGMDGPPPLPGEEGDMQRGEEGGEKGGEHAGRKPFRGPRGEAHPPAFVGQHDIIALVILILMLGMNLGVKLYFKHRRDQKHFEELERQSLEQQLEYLKYQINPHFFMNTLNNIHALVDIDPEKAKDTILELSKMMRFVLYEGNKAGVPLDRELSFLKNYVTLMKLRYTDKVRVDVKMPGKVPNKEVPPLMFITFVENAFKHGVSYRQESFIDIEVSILPTETGKELTFTCKNSRIPAEEDKHGGVGLANVKQRLDLIYGKNYTLDIKDEQETYTVKLTIPL